MVLNIYAVLYQTILEKSVQKYLLGPFSLRNLKLAFNQPLTYLRSTFDQPSINLDRPITNCETSFKQPLTYLGSTFDQPSINLARPLTNYETSFKQPLTYLGSTFEQP